MYLLNYCLYNPLVKTVSTFFKSSILCIFFYLLVLASILLHQFWKMMDFQAILSTLEDNGFSGNFIYSENADKKLWYFCLLTSFLNRSYNLLVRTMLLKLLTASHYTNNIINHYQPSSELRSCILFFFFLCLFFVHEWLDRLPTTVLRTFFMAILFNLGFYQ